MAGDRALRLVTLRVHTLADASLKLSVKTNPLRAIAGYKDEQRCGLQNAALH